MYTYKNTWNEYTFPMIVVIICALTIIVGIILVKRDIQKEETEMQTKVPVLGGSPWCIGDHTYMGTGRSVVQIPLEEENIFTFRFFCWIEPLNPSLPLERTFKSPS